MLTIEPLFRCDCNSIIRFDFEDLVSQFHERVFHLYCPVCMRTNALPPEFANRFKPADEPEKEPVKKKAPPPGPTPVQLERRKIEKAVEAEKAVHEHGSKVKAAKALGVSAQTITNRLGHLPLKQEEVA